MSDGISTAGAILCLHQQQLLVLLKSMHLSSINWTQTEPLNGELYQKLVIETVNSSTENEQMEDLLPINGESSSFFLWIGELSMII